MKQTLLLLFALLFQTTAFSAEPLNHETVVETVLCKDNEQSQKEIQKIKHFMMRARLTQRGALLYDSKLEMLKTRIQENMAILQNTDKHLKSTRALFIVAEQLAKSYETSSQSKEASQRQDIASRITTYKAYQELLKDKQPNGTADDMQTNDNIKSTSTTVITDDTPTPCTPSEKMKD